MKAGWPTERTDLVASLKAWWEPLLALAPVLRGAIGDACLIRTDGTEILVDFPAGTVSAHDGRDTGFRFTIPRPLLEMVVADHAVDWSNSLFLSCRFSAWRRGEYNEHLYNFFKSLSVTRMQRAEAEAVRRTAPAAPPSDTVRIGGFVVQRQCPHRQADLGEFGILDGDHIVCTLHGWRFRTSDGSCVNADDRRLEIHPAD
jgi:UDP-MurNAc hydroxylase